VAGASLQLAEGPFVTPAPSVIGGTDDGVNAIQYDDPFEEVTDMVGCTGVLARGGYTSAFDATFTGLLKTVGGVDYGRIFEGDVTVNAQVFACLADAAGLAEVMGHEIGHAIGFGHSSENPGESDPVLEDALMYFRVHDDGRGATLGDDDRAGMAAVYPADLLSPTPIAAFACRMDLGIFAPACFGQSLVVTPFQRFDKARKAGNVASVSPKRGKRRKQLKQAVRFLKKTDKAITAGIPGACGAAMRATVAQRIQEAGALLATE
jgi:hypothetical protein